MGRSLLEGRYRWLLLQRRGKGQRRCAKGLLGIAEDHHHPMGDVDHLIMVDPDLVLYPVHDHALPPIIRQVLEADIAQGPALLPRSGGVTTLYLLIEGTQTIQDHHLEVLPESERLITIAGHILQGSRTQLSQIKTTRENLHTSLMMREVSGGRRLVVDHQCRPLDQGVADKEGNKDAVA